MNLFDMAQRADRNLVLRGRMPGRTRLGKLADRLQRRFWPWAPPSMQCAKRQIQGRAYRGFDVTPGCSFTLLRPFRWSQYRTGRIQTGWSAVCLTEGSRTQQIELAFTAPGKLNPIALRKLEFSTEPVEVLLPQVSCRDQDLSDVDLSVRFFGPSGSRAFLAVHEILERKELISLCRGKGVEIGPGLNPQVRPARDVDVTYVEQATPDQWETLYNEKGTLSIDRRLWSRYVRGDAYPLPIADETLDFVFSSHVFEHLANPLGHLEHWHRKLRKGAIVAAIVPDFAGCKDYVFEPTSMSEVQQEFCGKRMQPSLHHYSRWAAIRAPGQDPETFMSRNRSIHVHFYTRENMAELLALACQQLGFERFEIRHTPNHKDFHFVLWK